MDKILQTTGEGTLDQLLIDVDKAMGKGATHYTCSANLNKRDITFYNEPTKEQLLSKKIKELKKELKELENGNNDN